MVKYHKLFEIKFYHEYYEAFSSKDFELHPTLSTVKNLTSFGIIFKQTAEGFVLLYNEEKERLLQKQKEEVSLQFSVIIKNRHFQTFSNVQSNKAKKYVFSNSDLFIIKSEDDGSGTKQTKLHAEKFIDERNVCFFAHNNVLLRELLGVDEVIVKKGDKTYFEGKLEKWQSLGEILGSSYGTFAITLENGNEEKLYYLNDSLNKVFGMVDLRVGGENNDFEIIKGTEYQVWFESREVQWNYYFISESGKFYDSVNLYSGKEKLEFTIPEEVTLINGKKASKVSSKETLPLRYRYGSKHFFAELEKNSTDSHDDFDKRKVNLTTPDVTRIKGARNDENEIYFSDMYIYL